MKRLFSHTLFLFIACVSSSLCSYAQIGSSNDFLWVKGGGSQYSNTNTTVYERTRYMAVDANKNVYGMSIVKGGNIKIDTFNKIQGYGYDDFVVFSFNCEGKLRWARHFGGSNNDVAGGLTLDAQGNVYVCGQVFIMPGQPSYFGDTALTSTSWKHTFVMKMDSLGKRIWLRTLVDTQENLNQAIAPMELKWDNSGTLHMFSWFGGTNVKIDGHVPVQKSMNAVKINSANGMVTGITKLQLGESAIYNINKTFQMDDAGNYYHVSGFSGDTLILNGNTLYNAPKARSVLIKFSSAGSVLWYKELQNYGTISIDSGANFAMGTKVIPSGNALFVTGTFRKTITIFGHTISNNISNTEPIPFIAKLNANDGSGIFVKTIQSTFRPTNSLCCQLPNGNIASVGEGGFINIINGNDTIKPTHGSNVSYPFVLQMDPNTGHFVSGEAIKSDALIDLTSSASDGTYSGLYFGGQFNNKLYSSTDSLTSHGGPSDFFVMRYAKPNSCNCNLSQVLPQAIPQTVSASGLNITVKTTPVTGADSVVWRWGNGKTTKDLQTGANVNYSYTTTGNYNVCLRTYSQCGDRDSCFSIVVTSIKELSLDAVNVYPNPVADRLTIENPYDEPAIVIVSDTRGAIISTQKMNGYRNSIDMSRLSPGMYIVTIQLEDGRRGVRKVVVQ